MFLDLDSLLYRLNSWRRFLVRGCTGKIISSLEWIIALTIDDSVFLLSTFSDLCNVNKM